MLRNHNAISAIREMTAKGVAQAAPAVKPDPAVASPVVLDAAAVVAAAADVTEAGAAVLDGTQADEQLDKDRGEHILDTAGEYAATDLALKAAAAVQEWADTPKSELEEGEGLGDRLFALMVGIVDDDMNGELSEEENDLLNLAAEQALDYLVMKGVPEDDAISLLSEYDNDLAETVQELVITKMPDGDEAAAAEIDAFVFGDGSDEAVMDAVYKKRVVVRQGKKVRINKRVSGTIRLSAAQKIAVRKMIRKSHSAKAQVRRSKSMKVRARMSI